MMKWHSGQWSSRGRVCAVVAGVVLLVLALAMAAGNRAVGQVASVSAATASPDTPAPTTLAQQAPPRAQPTRPATAPDKEKNLKEKTEEAHRRWEARREPPT